ncbi:hypothetical protein [Coleofasciculus sp. FACHB-T130]|uniref:hypothetical protein n=1 Tax=Cyanophyceae TaxID=3028117 RepID=UPI001688C975|nr:hypothetical protein [Coleofasciculus sp. FACHB-T130]MBD1881336.1 hypothetical protein [Coleofasciculus sp. FACHB-T130]
MNKRFTNNRVADRTKSFSEGFWNSGGAIALALLAMLVPGCVAVQKEAAAPEPTTAVEKVAQNTDQLIGQTVTVSGEVEEIIGPKAFQLEDDKIFSGEKVLVLNAVSATVPIAEGKNVTVTGQVRKFVLADFEKEYNLTNDLNVKKKMEAEFEGKPVVIAQTTQVIE